MILKWIKFLWELLNRLHPETRSLLIIVLSLTIFYSQITESTIDTINEKFKEENVHNKKAEEYSLLTSIEINRLVLLIAERDLEAFDVLLLNYHNNTLSLQGYKYLYLSCLTEAPKSLDTPTLHLQWNKIDYIYYADELAKIHGQSFVLITNIDDMSKYFPKLYRLVKASDAKAISFFTIEGCTSAIGLIVILYKEPRKYDANYLKLILPCILKLAILLDYESIAKK